MNSSDVRATFVLVSGGHCSEAFMLAERMKEAVEVSFIAFSGDALTLNQIPQNSPKALIAKSFQEIRSGGLIGFIIGSYRFLPSLFSGFLALQRFETSVVISTGSGPAIPILLAAKLLGIKVVYVECACRLRSLSLTGWLCYHLIADLFFVQWKGLAIQYPRAVFAGRLM